MVKIGRPGTPSAQRELAWALRREGKDLTEIARTVGSSRGAIYSLFLPFGGYHQAPQQRRAAALTAAEREEISRDLAAQESYRAIARRLGRHLTRHLRSRRALRGSRHRTQRGLGRGQIPDPVSIHGRPAEVADRVVPGHWDGDLPQGAGHTQIATMVERATRFTVLVQLDRKDTATVTAGLTRELMKLPEAVRRSLTWDRGPELAGHTQVTAYTGLQVYFADPKSLWQRGTNETTNRLLRQYFPKGTSLADLTQADPDAVAARLNA